MFDLCNFTIIAIRKLAGPALFVWSGLACAGELPRLPPGWDASLAGDMVLQRLVSISPPRVKGAHDAEFVCVGDRAFVVYEANDQRPGESAAWPFVSVMLTAVNLGDLEVQSSSEIARGEQVFQNVTLPVGACFVPRVLQKDGQTLRCYFASEQPGQRQAQSWYRDFDLPTQRFANTIHRAKLRTAAGVFDMQPQHFHAAAVAAGFRKPPQDFGLYIFDAFKTIGGRTYVALNSFPGKQNALAVLHDDLATFEILGHYNEPQTADLSESAVNRLPDGSWLAICRNDRGNYLFTTSPDGCRWTAGRELPQVPNGTNSKPTLDRFGETYYLGWQEQTRFQGVFRSVFNIDISLDGRHWVRKYRFETPRSFQYPTFHEHRGTIWLTVTQGDSSPSRKEQIAFGRLEQIGQFESQTGHERIHWPDPTEQPAVMKPGVRLFTDRDYAIDELPAAVEGLPLLRTSIENLSVEVTAPGLLFAVSPTLRPGAASQELALTQSGFVKVDSPETQLFPGVINRVSLYRRRVQAGETFRFKKFVVFVLSDGAELRLR